MANRLIKNQNRAVGKMMTGPRVHKPGVVKVGNTPKVSLGLHPRKSLGHGFHAPQKGVKVPSMLHGPKPIGAHPMHSDISHPSGASFLPKPPKPHVFHAPKPPKLSKVI